VQITRGTVVEAAGLRRVFRAGPGELVAVDSVDLAIPAGIVFGFLGPNGAGKSTTIRVLVTLLAPSDGRAAVAGFDVERYPAEVRRRIGYVAQGGSTSAVETGREELVMQARAFGGSRHDAERRADELITRFQLAEAAGRLTGGWSGGQRRRLDIALGLVHRPSVLFLDEPTTGLDPQSRANLWEQIGRLRDEGVTTFLTTHYLEEADALAERIAIIDHGRIVAEGTPGDLKRQISGDVIEIGADSGPGQTLAVLRAQPFVRSAALAHGVVRIHVDDGPSDSVSVLRVLDRAGLLPSSLTVRRPSLDDVFLTKTGRSLREGSGALLAGQGAR
jgi:ABC-2 type transport system ATP-binding protein